MRDSLAPFHMQEWKGASSEKLINVFINVNQISAGPTGALVKTENKYYAYIDGDNRMLFICFRRLIEFIWQAGENIPKQNLIKFKSLFPRRSF